MNRVLIEFRPGRGSTWFGAAAGRKTRFLVAGALAAGIALALWSGWRHWELRQTDMAQAEQSSRELEKNRAAARPRAPAFPEAHLRAMNHMVEQLNAPWPAILDALEQRVPSQVALLSIEPDAIRGRVRLEFEAKQLPPLLDFVRQLEGAGPFERVSITKHELLEREPGAPYRMVLDADLARQGQLRVQGAKP